MKVFPCSCGAAAEVRPDVGMCGESGFMIRAACGNREFQAARKARVVSTWNASARVLGCPVSKARHDAPRDGGAK